LTTEGGFGTEVHHDEEHFVYEEYEEDIEDEDEDDVTDSEEGHDDLRPNVCE
jgi:hypothetical protein